MGDEQNLKSIQTMPKILVIEDDPIDLISIKAKIKALGYDEPVVSGHEVDFNQKVLEVNPQLVISDIYCDNKPVGLAMVEVCDSLDIPLILITADTRMETFDLANKSHKVTYLVKPFHHLTLQTCIDKVMMDVSMMSPADSDFCYVKDYTNRKVKLHYRDILFIKADGNFCHIQCQHLSYMIRTSLSHFNSELDSQFLQVHKSFIVNKAHVETITSNHLVVVKQEIPIGRKYRNSVSELFPVLK